MSGLMNSLSKKHPKEAREVIKAFMSSSCCDEDKHAGKKKKKA